METKLFYPYISKSSFAEVKKVLSGRWIGQGPLVDKFEKKLKICLLTKTIVLLLDCRTDALHLAYILAGLKKGDEVIAPVYTCTATNIFLHINIKFADIDIETMKH